LVIDVVNRYSDAANRRDVESILELWTDDGVWDVGPPISLLCEGRAAIAEVLARIRSFELLVQVPSPVVVRVDGDVARAHVTIQETTRGPEPGVGWRLTGIYEDELVRELDRWRFKRRTLRIVHADRPAPLGTVRPAPFTDHRF
jgi:ketosteroid isomerase-like protein